MPEVESGLHGVNYSKALGFDSIHPNIKDWSGECQPIKLRALHEMHNKECIDASNKLYVVEFEHDFASAFSKSHALSGVEPFNFIDALEFLEGYQRKKIDVLIHLRLGDSYIYKISDEIALHARKRKIIKINDENIKELEDQWNIDQVKSIINNNKKLGLTYRIHCDGVESAMRHIKWSKSEDYKEIKEDLMGAVKNFEQKLLKQFKCDPNFIYANSDVVQAVIDIIQARKIIYTQGGFAIHVNRYLSSKPADTQSIASFINVIGKT
jgi:hypothetical protein